MVRNSSGFSQRGLDAEQRSRRGSVAFEVGYESATKFNRECSRFFGQPPVGDIRALRSLGVAAAEAISNQASAA
jgi:AraC-like DNA-binding protein